MGQSEMNSAICKDSNEMIPVSMINVINKDIAMERDLGSPFDSNFEQIGNSNKAKIKAKESSIKRSFIQYIPAMTRHIERSTEASRREYGELVGIAI